MRFFGFEITWKTKEQNNDTGGSLQLNPYASTPSPSQVREKSFSPPNNLDGAIVLNSGAHYATTIDLDGSAVRNEVEQINKYRDMAIVAEVEYAIDNIVNEAIVREESGKTVEIRLENAEIPVALKKKVQKEFDQIIRLFNFNYMGQELFRRWYIDGRIYFHMIIDEKKKKDGIKEIRLVDPRRIRKIREVARKKDPTTGADVVTATRDYYLYNERGISSVLTSMGLQITPDSIVYVPSGLFDKTNQVIGYLQKAIKPLNNLRMEEDALVIYRLARAPERRAFYIDVGSMMGQKAQEYLEKVMASHRTKMIYDAVTGEIRDDRRILSMMEDFWLPRREGGKGTEISTLPGGENLGKIEDVEYFQNKLYKALGVPISRLESTTGFQLGKAAEITRDELNFMKFIDRLRVKFSTILFESLKTQLLLKGIVREEEWEEFSDKIYFDFLKDNDITRLREQEAIRESLGIMALVEPYIGKYYSAQWARKNILNQTEDEMEAEDKQIEKEKADPRWQNPMMPMNNPEMNGDMQPGGPAWAADQQMNQEKNQNFDPENFVKDMEDFDRKKQLRLSSSIGQVSPPQQPGQFNNQNF